MVLTVSFVLFPGTGPGTGLSCPRHCADRNRATRHQRLDARTTRLRRPHRDRWSAHETRAAIQGVHRIPRSTFVTIAKRPSCERRTARILLLIFGRVKRYSEKRKQPGATCWHDGQFAHGAQAFAACAHLGPSSSLRASREAESDGPAPCVEAVCSAYRFGAVRWTRLNALPNALSEA